MSIRSGSKTIFSNKGFTLIEMMVVLVIIALIASIATISVTKSLHNGRLKATQSQLAVLKQAISLFELDFGRVPRQSEGLAILMSPPQNKQRYIDAKELPRDGWGNAFVYVAPGEEQAIYMIASYGADGAEGGIERNADLYTHAY